MALNSIWVTWPATAKALGGAGVLIGAITLASTRDKLLKNNMFDVQGKYAENIDCDNRSLGARTEDGTCNDLKNPAMGAAYVRFGRNVPVASTHGESDEKLLDPNPREVSLELMTREEFVPAKTLNFIAASWIQFMTHDWFSHGENDKENPIVVPLAANDPFSQDELVIRRSRKDPTRTMSEKDKPRTFQNTNTHWWDGSQIYGSDLETSNSVRSFEDGKLKVDDRGRLPTQWNGKPVTGFDDNWWVGLSMLHQLFVLEHNSIADMLKKNNPSWSDQKIYDKARLINSALMARIHTVEWTPAILSNPVLETAMNANWNGILGPGIKPGLKILAKGANSFFSPLRPLLDAAVKRNPDLQDFASRPASIDHALSGLVGAPQAEFHGVPYTLTEEFVAIYRMHSLIRDEVEVYSMDQKKLLASIPVNETRDGEAEKLLDTYSPNDLWYSFGVTHPGALTLNNFPKFMQDIEIPLVGQLDLATTDIVRDRERGVPRYNEFRRLVGLKPIRSFEDLTKDPAVLAKLKKVYKNDIEKIDLLIGSQAETVRPDGFGFGETTFQLFILNASRRLMADRFFTEDYRPEIYTKAGINWVEKNSMRSVLLRHFPALAKGMGKESNAFKPWK